LKNNGVVNTHQEPIEPIDCLELRTDTSPLVVAVVHARVVVVAHTRVVVVAHTRAVVVAHTQAVVAVQVAAPRELRKFLVCQQHVPHPP
jgi:hypothetical protein